MMYSTNNTFYNVCTNSNDNNGFYFIGSDGNTIRESTVSLNSFGSGIYLKNSKYNTINSSLFESNNMAIWFDSSNFNELNNNNINDSNNYGIYLSSSDFTELADNVISNTNGRGINLDSNSNNNNIKNNTLFSNNDGIFILSYNNNISFNKLTFNSQTGINIQSSQNTVEKNAVSNSIYGMRVWGGEDNLIVDNTLSYNDNGIILSGYGDSIVNNTIHSIKYYGIALQGAREYIILNNEIYLSKYGIYSISSVYNTIFSNNISDNNYGIYLTSSQYTTISKNNIINHSIYIAFDDTISNNWFYNYYNDYTGTDLDTDGIGDTAYYIIGGSGAVDNLPLMQPLNQTSFYGAGAQYTLNVGEKLQLYEGYSIHVYEIDADGQKAWIAIWKDGEEIDNFVINEGNFFTFTGDNNNVLIFARVETVFAGMNSNLVKFEMIYQIINGSILIDSSDDLPKPAPSITLSSPSSSSVSNTEGDSATFTATVDQVANVTWILDGNTIQTNTSVITASYHNTSAQLGTHNLTVFAENANGTDQKMWTWNIDPEIFTITDKMIYEGDGYQINNYFIEVTDIISFDGELLFDTTIYQLNLDGSYDELATSIMIVDNKRLIKYQNGSIEILVNEKNLTSQYVIVDITILGIAVEYQAYVEDGVGNAQYWDGLLPTIIYNPSSSSISNYVNNPRTFNLTVSQVANITWILDGITLYTNTSVTTASYYNSSAQLGTHNLTVLVENANCSLSKKWTWTVTDPNLYTMQLQKGWNLVSTPLTPDNPDVNTLFGSNNDVILPVYSWNTANKQYYDVSTIEISKGYWILALNDTQVTFAGAPYSG